MGTHNITLYISFIGTNIAGHMFVMTSVEMDISVKTDIVLSLKFFLRRIMLCGQESFLANRYRQV